MSQVTTGLVLAVLVVFCRIGGCLMLMPGFSSPRVPMRVRLFVALAVVVAISPLIVPGIVRDVGSATLPALGLIIVGELALGMLIGLLGRSFFSALQFMATGIATFAGVGSMPGAPAIDDEPMPAIASLIMVTVTVLIFITDQHLEVVKTLVASYGAIPVGTPFDAAGSLRQLTATFTTAFQLALQVSGPFVVYALAVNFLFGLANKMVPQVPVYFISLPFVIAGGLALLYIAIMEALPVFMSGFAHWLVEG